MHSGTIFSFFFTFHLYLIYLSAFLYFNLYLNSYLNVVHLSETHLGHCRALAYLIRKVCRTTVITYTVFYRLHFLHSTIFLTAFKYLLFTFTYLIRQLVYLFFCCFACRKLSFILKANSNFQSFIMSQPTSNNRGMMYQSQLSGF